LFGVHAQPSLQATFKIVKNTGEVVNDNDLKSRIISSINKFFALSNWDFGETFHFSELVTYVMNQNAPDISNMLIVPKQGTQAFGSLYEIKCENDELFVSDATVADVEIIDSVTASKIQASGAVVSSTGTNNVGIQSQPLTSTTANNSSSSSSSSSSNSSGGSSY
jgi:hypothetical protein